MLADGGRFNGRIRSHWDRRAGRDSVDDHPKLAGAPFAPNFAARRAIWLVWCLCLHPERLESLEDLVTWGRFHAERRPVQRPAEEWCDWSI
jgi:hypothetical protein